MNQFMQMVITGLTTGAIYSISALGFTIVYNATRVTNFANGEFVMMGGLLSAGLVTSGLATFTGFPVVAAVLLSCLIVTVLGVAIDWAGIQHARRKVVLSYAMITIGFGISYRGLMQTTVSREILFPPAFGVFPNLYFGDLYLSSQSLWILAVLAVVSAALSFLFMRTRIGKAMRAASQQPRAASLCGINPRIMAMISFGMAGFLGAAAGTMIAPIGGAFYEFGLFFGLKGFAAAILGGFGSSIGAVIGGLLIGLAETLTAGYISSDYKDAVALAILVVLLLVRPSGLMGHVEARRV